MPTRDPEKKKAQRKRWAEAHPEQAAEAQRRWRQNNRKDRSEYNRAWRVAHGLNTSGPRPQSAEAFRGDPSDPRHGTANGYNNLKCLCAPCRAAWAAHVRDRRSRAAGNG